MGLVRHCPLTVLDVLEGCRQLIGVGYQREAYLPLIEDVLNRFFFKPDSEPFVVIAQRRFDVDPAIANETKSYVEREILPRIQRSFGIIYPNRHYDYVWDAELQCIMIREFEHDDLARPSLLETVHAPTNDISDDWIPERLRR